MFVFRKSYEMRVFASLAVLPDAAGFLFYPSNKSGSLIQVMVRPVRMKRVAKKRKRTGTDLKSARLKLEGID